MTYSQAQVVCEKKQFPIIRFSRQITGNSPWIEPTVMSGKGTKIQKRKSAYKTK